MSRGHLVMEARRRKGPFVWPWDEDPVKTATRTTDLGAIYRVLDKVQYKYDLT